MIWVPNDERGVARVVVWVKSAPDADMLREFDVAVRNENKVPVVGDDRTRIRAARTRALNNEMKKEVLAKIDTSALTGKTIAVVGAFKLVNPKSWLVTPVRLEVQ